MVTKRLEDKKQEHAPKVDERVHPRPVDDAPGDEAPGFGGEGQRTELAHGKAIDPVWRKRFAEHNRQVSEEEDRKK
ncbi:MAG: hypothetical protein BGO98_18795 [Myxococcales bacterium 68-20]|nr:hypothetical protein [Myxococcales bacterium]OJY24685.1 MAG: hypothetical protein BGO98_18795 [Myxococcales bacterium 68-20]